MAATNIKSLTRQRQTNEKTFYNYYTPLDKIYTEEVKRYG